MTVLLLVSTHIPHQCFYLFSLSRTTDKLLTYCHHYTTWVRGYTYIFLSSVFVLWCCRRMAVHLRPVSHRLMCHCCVEIEQTDNTFENNELLNSLQINEAKISRFAPFCMLLPCSCRIYNSFAYFFAPLPCYFQHFTTVSSYSHYALLSVYLRPPLPLSCVHARMRLSVCVRASHVRVPQTYAGLKDDKCHSKETNLAPRSSNTISHAVAAF